MSKRPPIDLLALTSEHAAPMPESSQRTTQSAAPAPSLPKSIARQLNVKTANLEGLAFKVSPAFRKRFKQRAVNADLKLNELLFAALDAWEEKNGIKK
jgi:hypothetical protein